MAADAPPYVAPHWRAAIFGAARVRKQGPECTEVYRPARGLALQGFDGVAGGGPGLMHAADAGRNSAAGDGRSIGLDITLPREQGPNRFLDIEAGFQRFGGRRDAFVSISDASVPRGRGPGRAGAGGSHRHRPGVQQP